jgi:hypothetical protein
MATESESSHGFLYFIVGILLVAVVIGGIVLFNGRDSSGPGNVIERSADAVGDAADEVGDAAGGRGG